MAFYGCAPTVEPRVRYDQARAKLHQGYVDAAAQEADEGFRQLEGRDPLWGWRFRLLKAETLLWKSDSKGANGLLSAAPPQGLPSEISIRRKILQGRALCRLGRPAESEAALNDAKHLAKPEERELRAELAFAWGRCTPEANRDTARAFYQQSANLAHGVDAFGEARGLVNVGYLLLTEGKYPAYHQAINILTTSLSISDSYLLREQALGNLAEANAELGDWKQSIAFAEEAEKLAGQINNAGDQEVWLIDAGRAHFAIHEYSDAEPYYSRALAIAKRLNDTDNMWRCLNNLTELALTRHDLNTAEKYWREESALNVGNEGRAYVTVDAAEIALEHKDFGKAEQLFKEVLQSKPKNSLRLTTERELGNVYWQENRIVEADQAFLQAIKDVEDTISKLPPEYRMSFLDEDPFYDSYVRFLVAQGRKFDALKIAERGRAQILSQATAYGSYRQSAFSLEAVQAALKRRNQIALAYSLTNEESFAWLITPTQFNVFRLPSHVMLHPQVDAFSAEVDQHRRIEDSPAGQELYKSLIGQVGIPISKDSRVVIIPSKILSLVSFESLIVPASVPGSKPRYWIDDVEIETASSLAMLARPRAAAAKSAKSKKELLLLGAAVQADKDFPFLQNASDEMSRVRSHFPANQETVISGKDALPQAYRASNPGEYRFIHIDAHSAASELNPLKSFVVLSPAADHSYKLFADEITETPLHAELVTLSACYGAGTRWYNGEGIVGLGWAFLRAGAHQVVASLWTVDDASTPQLMDDFYGELSKGKSAAEALRAAKLKMLHSDGPKSRPFYWASLQLYTRS